MTNFDFLSCDKDFATFAETASDAEKIFSINTKSCVLTCRAAMEDAVKWMYSVDHDLVLPREVTLFNLINDTTFRDIVGDDIWKRMDLIRRVGNIAAHSDKKVTPEQAELCVENLFWFMDCVAYMYAPQDKYEPVEFDRNLLKQHVEPVVDKKAQLDIQKLMEENQKLRDELTARREEQSKTYTPKPLEISEYKTRKIYIDSMLVDAGWNEGKDWINELELDGMPNKTGKGYADYVLFGNDGRPLAVIEAKRTCEDPAVGRHQAKLYADILEKKYGRRPVVFLTNGFETRIVDNQYPERRVSSIYSKRDLEKLFNLHSMRTSLANAAVNKSIAGRYYQEGAVKAVCDAFDKENRRKALLVMATGSGKTRTVISLCDVLLRHGWVKNILFLADRTSLVTQAKRSFVNLLPNLSVTNLCEDKDNYNAHCVFSTYPTMMNCIDTVCDEAGKLFTSGHFDLIICDEAHRSIYNKYRDIFNYFDAPLVGLTATPKEDIDKNTYEIFELPNGSPVYHYDLNQAVSDGYLVKFVSIETKLKFIDDGIVYDELSDEDKAEYEDTFIDEDGELPESIASSALNEWVFNIDTIRKVLDTVMTNGLKIDYGSKIGKTIIFAKNHLHAEKILEVFNKEYPHLVGYATVIDNKTKYAQKLIDDFSDPKKLPQIAISVDMLDTGIDVPEVLNLVFFKKVMSHAKFWQMIGRGTRLCPELLDGEDKQKFYIFDFCRNFEFFRMGGNTESQRVVSLQTALFSVKAELALKLQGIDYQTDELIAFRQELVDDMVAKVQELNKENFAVHQHLKYVEMYADPERYKALTYEDVVMMQNEVAPLIQPYDDEAKALRFDYLMYMLEFKLISGDKYTRGRTDLLKKVTALSQIGNIPAINAQKPLIDQILHTEYLDKAGIGDFERIRQALRDLIKYIPRSKLIFDTDMQETITDISWNDSEIDSDGFANYKDKAEHYIKEHQDNEAIAKLKSNIPLSTDDIKELETILWSEVGTKQDYEAEVGKPLGEFVRSIVGMDMRAAKEAFSDYLTGTNLDSRQIYFVNQIVEYIVHNGMMKDLSVLQEAPFTDKGSIVEIFTDISVWMGIKSVIDKINANAAA